MSFVTRTITTTEITRDGCGRQETEPGDREQAREVLASQGWTVTYGSFARVIDWCPKHGPTRPPTEGP